MRTVALMAVAVVVGLLLGYFAAVGSTVAEFGQGQGSGKPDSQVGAMQARTEQSRVEPLVGPLTLQSTSKRAVVTEPPAPRQTPARSPLGRDEVAPRTADEREAFIRLVLEPQVLDLSKYCFLDLIEKLRQSINPDLPIDDKAKAELQIGEVCTCELAYRTELSAALIQYVRSVPDLATPAAQTIAQGRAGTIRHGVGPGSEALWGTAKQVTVNYNIRYADYERLSEAATKLATAKANLKQFQKPTRPR